MITIIIAMIIAFIGGVATTLVIGRWVSIQYPEVAQGADFTILLAEAIIEKERVQADQARGTKEAAP